MKKMKSVSLKKFYSGSLPKTFSVSPTDYQLLEEVGYGASATVYRAIYKPDNEIVAVKCLDLDRCNSNLDDIRREAQTMSLIDHPNLIKAFCSFVVEHSLWVVMPFMAQGSCLHLMKAAYPDGFEEPVIGSILKETLKALEYLHNHGHIHRDVKAGNILLDNSGAVKLADFGVTACMFDKGDRQSSRNTFVGTPCWMAPEVLQPGSGYNFKADIWSFGITALELAHGHAPFSKYPPMKVLLMTLQNAPPGLDYDRDKRFSKSFKEMVAMCLVKDQTKRPTAEKLLKHTFFKIAKPPELTVKSHFADLPPLWDRVKALQLKDAAQLALKKMPSAEQEALSQSEYQRGVSAWNFDVEDLKVQASLIQDDEDFAETKEDNDQCTSGSFVEKPLAANEIGLKNFEAEWSEGGGAIKMDEHQEKDSSDFGSREDIDRSGNVSLKNDSVPSTSKQDVEPRWKTQVGKKHQTYSGPLLPSSMHNNSLERGQTSERVDAENILATERCKRDSRKTPNLSGPLMLPTRASSNSLSAPIRYSSGYGDSSEDKFRSNVVQIKGRFSVTSENVERLKDVPMGTIPRRSSQGSLLTKSGSVGDFLVSKQVPLNQLEKDNINGTLPASILMPHLQNLFQQTSFQQDLLTNLLNSLQQNGFVDVIQAGVPLKTDNPEEDILVDTTVTERERLLLAKISELQTRMISLTDELTAMRMKHVQLQQQLSTIYSQEEDRKEEFHET
ncbi:serine/threonine-protein kinase BLUS1-like isoform X2 [Phalaenopsis equestris]|uniref:serine/threonine-protein kinase BLUS1-like isoform X2 n=1 Tax=Phalaenopsis equestris TaxID=78828 RepID=UPI0009E1CFD1|nr:serine/threonine-protein kinase BLUS1-like isoform X2 [Phalaenopsis equestris]